MMYMACQIVIIIYHMYPSGHDDSVHTTLERHHNRKIAVALSRDANGSYEYLTARSHPAVGYTMKLDLPEIENPQGKYNFMLEPVNRLLMHAARRGVKIVEGFLYSSLVPTAREQVNMIGAGLHSIYVGNMAKSRDECGLQAMETLRNAGTISFLPFAS